MALISCPVCAKDVSQQAPTCPHCGHPVAQSARKEPQPVIIKKRSGLGGCFIVLLIIFIIFCIGAAGSKPDEFKLRSALLERYGLIYGAGVIAEKIGFANIKYNDYVVFSTISVQLMGGREQTAAFGIFGKTIILEDALSSLKSLEQRPPGSTIQMPVSSPVSQNQQASGLQVINYNCYVFNDTGGNVKLRRDCNTKDCSKDPSTLYIDVPHNTQLGLVNLSNYSSGKFTWRPVFYNNQILWISTTRLNCL